MNDGSLDRVAKAIGERRVIPPDPSDRTPSGDNDDPEQLVSMVEPDDSAATTAFISYENASGEKSERTVTFRKITGHYSQPESIYGYCHHRNALRQFRVDRISEMVCIITGELLDPVMHCHQLAQLGALKIEDKALTELMRLLTFMARCDGEFHFKEQKVLEELLGRYCLRFGGDDVMVENAIIGTNRLAPSSEDLLKSLRAFARMPEGPRICRFALESSGAIIDADGRHAPEEIQWAVEVSSALKNIADRK